MLAIKVGPVWSHISGTGIPAKELSDTCSYTPTNVLFMKGKGGWDGKKRLYRRDNYFPTGLWSLVAEVLKAKGIEYKASIAAFPEPSHGWALQNITLTKEQQEAIALGHQFKRGIFRCPTGFGKTTGVAAGLISSFGVPTLFVVHQNILLDQAKEAFEKHIAGTGEIGVIGNGIVNIQPVTVASIQTLRSRLTTPAIKKALASYFEMVIIDEIQFHATPRSKKVLYACNAPYRFGLSATPTRSDGATLELHAITGRVICSFSPSDMIDAGRISDVHITFKRFDHKLRTDNYGLDYNEVYKEFIVNSEKRNELIIQEVSQLVKNGEHVLLLVRMIEHGHLLHDILKQRGIAAEFIYGDTHKKDRDRIINDLKQSKIRVLIASTIADIGFDCPIVSAVVVASAGAVKERIPQRIGRALRKHFNKEKAIIIDIADLRIPFFTNQYKHRYKTCQAEFGVERVEIQ